MRIYVCEKCGGINPDFMTDESGTYHDGCGCDNILLVETMEKAKKLAREIKIENAKDKCLEGLKEKE